MKSTLRSLCPKLCQLHLEGWFQNITSEWLAYKLGNLWLLHPVRNYLGLKSPDMYEGESRENLKNEHTFILKYLRFSFDSPSYNTHCMYSKVCIG